MGSVEIAVRTDSRFSRLCAVKRLHPHLRQDPEFRAMFLDEARIAGLINHPNVVSVLDVGEDTEGPYLVMDYIAGLSVRRLIGPDKAQLPMQVALRIVEQAARGLHAAHHAKDHEGNSLGVIHRDVSPANLLLGFDGLVRVADFGIARAAGKSTKTSTGVLKGKLAYMAPEQLRFRKIDQRVDLWALGVVLFELVAGRRLYEVTEEGGLAAILEDPPPDLGTERDDVPPALVSLVFRALAKRAENRPESAESMGDQLAILIEDLVAEEGAIELLAFVQETLGAAQTKHDEVLEESMRAWRTSVEHTKAQSELVPGQVSPLPTPLPVGQSLGGTRWKKAAIATLTLGAGALVALMWTQDPEPLAEPTTLAPEHTAAAAAPALAPAPTVVLPEQAALPTTPITEEVEEVDDQEDARADEAATAAARRRRRVAMNEPAQAAPAQPEASPVQPPPATSAIPVAAWGEN